EGAGHSNDSANQTIAQNIAHPADVSLFINGHNHQYVHCHIPAGNEGVPAGGEANHVTAGGGGAPLYAPDSGAPYYVAGEASYHYVRFDISGDTLTSTAYRLDGSIIETFTIQDDDTVDVRVSTSADDVEERLSDGAMYLTSTDIELGDDLELIGEQSEGLRFQNVAIPQGATITSAYLEFETDEVGSTPTIIEIRAQAADNAPVFSTANYDLTSRPTTSAFVVWDIPAWNIVDQKHQSPDLASVVQEVVNRPGWNANNSIVFVITGTGTRTAEAYDGEPDAAARLHVEYTVPSVDVWVSTSADDVEERLSDGAMYLTSTDIELGDDLGLIGEQSEGLRFQNVAIPQGATITAAYLEFETDEAGSTPTIIDIRAQAADNAPVFSAANYDLTSRPTTAAFVVWDIPAWNTVDEKHRSPDLAAMVQEVVDRPGWSSNNSMAFVITGTGTRTAEAYDGEPDAAARLHVEYLEISVDDNYEQNDTWPAATDPLGNGGQWELTWLSSIDGPGFQSDDDWYQIAVTPVHEWVFVACGFSHTQGNIDIALHDSAGTFLTSSTSTTDNEFLYYKVDGPGTYYMRAYGDNAGNVYDLVWVDLWSDDPYEPGPYPLPELTWLSSIDGPGFQYDSDWYQISVTAGSERVFVACGFSHAQGNIDIALYDSFGTLLTFSVSTTDNEFIDYTVAGPGTYSIRVYGDNTGNAYDLAWVDLLVAAAAGQHNPLANAFPETPEQEDVHRLEAPDLPGLQLANSYVNSWNGQVTDLDFDSEQDVTTYTLRTDVHEPFSTLYVDDDETDYESVDVSLTLPVCCDADRLVDARVWETRPLLKYKDVTKGILYEWADRLAQKSQAGHRVSA
ncbi:MAG: PPC domain-containing protein, partial [Planctomycetota bacterium]